MSVTPVGPVNGPLSVPLGGRFLVLWRFFGEGPPVAVRGNSIIRVNRDAKSPLSLPPKRDLSLFKAYPQRLSSPGGDKVTKGGAEGKATKDPVGGPSSSSYRGKDRPF